MRPGLAGLGRLAEELVHHPVQTGLEFTIGIRAGGQARTIFDKIGCAVAMTPFALPKTRDVAFAVLADDAPPKIGQSGRTTFSGDHHWWIEGTVFPSSGKGAGTRGSVFYSSIGHEPDDPKALQVTEIIRRRSLWTTRRATA